MTYLPSRSATLVIRNSGRKNVRVFGRYTVGQGQQVDLFLAIPGITEEEVAKELLYGDLRNEILVKRSLDLIDYYVRPLMADLANVATLADRNDLPESSRFTGMSVFVKSEITSYQLGPGLSNADWEVSSTTIGAPLISVTQEIQIFADGSDGDLVVSTPITYSLNKYFRNLTIEAGGSISLTNGVQIFVSEILDLTNAPANAITSNGNAGGNAAVNAAGAAGTASTSGLMFQQTIAGAIGVAGGTAAGTIGTSLSAAARLNGGVAGATGSGGTGISGAGGAGRALLAPTSTWPIRYIAVPLLRGIQQLGGGQGAMSGGSGGGDGTAGGGSGGGGAGAGVVYIAARIISRGPSTTAGAISAVGGAGGAGGVPAAGNRGGGAGGGGAGGGWIYLVYGELTGSVAANALNVSGGAGGAGGNGTGTGTGGTGAQGGGGGSIDIFNAAAGTRTGVVAGLTGGTVGGSPSGITGGTSGPGESIMMDL